MYWLTLALLGIGLACAFGASAQTQEYPLLDRLAERVVHRTLPYLWRWDETLDVGLDTGTPVGDSDYQVPFAFTGKLHRLTLKIEPPVLTEADKQKLMQAHQNNAASQ